MKKPHPWNRTGYVASAATKKRAPTLGNSHRPDLDRAHPGTLKDAMRRVETKLIALRVPVAMERALLARAHERRQTVSEIIRRAIERELRRMGE